MNKRLFLAGLSMAAMALCTAPMPALSAAQVVVIEHVTVVPMTTDSAVLLDADPLLDIANTRRIAGVFVNGRWTDRRKLDAMLADLAKRNTADKARFDWNTVTGR